MTASPTVTVVMAVKDGEDYLAGAIESVLAQTFTKLELLVVDDGSRDRTPAILDAVTDPRLRVLRNDTNVGEAPSRNRALREARGTYVAILDHDDTSRRDRLQRQVAVLDADPRVAVVGSWATLVIEDGSVVGHVRQSIDDYPDFLFWCLVGGIRLPHSSATFRREVVLRLGGYDESFSPSEDLDLLLRLALYRHEARIVEEELIRYRLHERQLSRVHEARQRDQAARAHSAFLRGLAGDAPVDVDALRLLLSGDGRLLDRGETAAPSPVALERFLDAVEERVGLSGAERAELERRLRLRVLDAARRVGSYGSGLPLVRYGAAAGGSEALAGVALYAVAPAVRAGTTLARRLTRPLLAHPSLLRFEGPLRRSPVARRLYSWLRGG